MMKMKTSNKKTQETSDRQSISQNSFLIIYTKRNNTNEKVASVNKKKKNRPTDHR